MKPQYLLKSAFILAFSVIAALPAHAQFWGKSGSGKIISDLREVPTFSKVRLTGSGDVVITKGDKREVRVEADDNIIEDVRTEVNENGTITLGMAKGSWNNVHLKFIITNPTLEGVEISGSGSVNVESNFDSKEMLTGISGSGDIRFRGGKAGRHEIRISGSGNVKSESLEADDVTVRVSGSGNATVFAKKTLNAQISGSGDVYYKGTPSITKSIRGSGSLVQR
ncbi:MAG: head GIN domain-containing protein [Candidatus Kapaibacteriota bacterium]